MSTLPPPGPPRPPRPSPAAAAPDSAVAPRERCRAWAIGVIGLVVVLVGAAAWRLLTSLADDDGTAGEGGWNAIAGLAESGDVVVLGRDGAELDRIATGHPGVDLTIVHAAGSRVVLHDARAAQIIVVDTASGEADELDVPRDAIVRPVVGSEVILLAVSTAGSAQAVVVNIERAERIDLGTAGGFGDDGLFLHGSARAEPSGTAVAVLESRSVRTVVVAFADDTDPLTVEGAPVALSTEQIVLAVTDRGGSAIEYLDRGGERLRIVPVDRPRATLSTDGGEIVVLTEAGEMVRTTAVSDEAQRVGSIEPGGVIEFALPALDGARIVVGTESSVLVFAAADGDEIGALDDLVSTRPQLTGRVGRCVSFGEGEISTLDTETGQVVATTAGTLVSQTSLDGCTLVVEGTDGPRVVRNGAPVVLSDSRGVARLAPDGTAAVVVDDDRVSRLVELDDPAQTVELGTDLLRFAFVER